ncbi:twin-arginine translocation signal domain-containing protein [Propionibacteriaceae bacterium Y1700]|uniref:twin-arginine translocation signal domain-containing protein n=1 Tax=Microlunatus sp. Y1700 TaxID=3418487 RepID=UPI003DA6FF9A
MINNHRSGRVGRRTFMQVSGVGGLAAAVGVTGQSLGTSAANAAEPADRQVVLVGANPGIQLFDGDTVTAYASAWRVDWSRQGRGNALVLWHDDKVHLYGDNAKLAHWVCQDFTRHFPEVEGLPWPDPIFHHTPARIDIDLETGLRASAGPLRMRCADVRGQRQWITDDFPLGEVPHSLALVLGPAFVGQISLRGRRLPGAITTSGTADRANSSAFVTEAEVWRA